MILTPEETNALLTELSHRDCGRDCTCAFCTVFEEGRKSGEDDAYREIRRRLGSILSRAG